MSDINDDDENEGLFDDLAEDIQINEDVDLIVDTETDVDDEWDDFMAEDQNKPDKPFVEFDVDNEIAEEQRIFDKYENDDPGEETGEPTQEEQRQTIDELLEEGLQNDDEWDEVVKEQQPEQSVESIEPEQKEDADDDEITVESVENEEVGESEPVEPNEPRNGKTDGSAEVKRSDDDEVVVESVENAEIEAVKDDSEEDYDYSWMGGDGKAPTIPEFNPDMIKGPKDLEKSEVENIMGVEEFMFEMWHKRINKLYQEYTESQLYGFLAAAKRAGEKEMNVVRDMYIQNYAKFSRYINFNVTKNNTDLWLLVANEYDQYVKMKNYSPKNVDFISKTKGPEGAKNPNDIIVQDQYIAEMIESKRKADEEDSKYRIDRTIFDITEDDDSISVFEDKKTLSKDFYDSPFFKVLKNVFESDKSVVDMSGVYSRVIISEETSYIPLVDFSTGIRLVCIDTEDVDQFHINAMLIARKVKFTYDIPRGSLKIRMLYSDNCLNCLTATVMALRKLIAYKNYNPRLKVNLSRNYTIAYTTERRFIDLFERGDPDYKREGSSTYSSPRANNMAIGVIALDKKSEKDRQNIRRNQFRRDSGIEQMSTDDYNIYFILSARVIRNDLRLRDPTYPKNERYVEYTITQYTENNKSIIEDGFPTICACIIKEHLKNYDPGINYAISYEYDRSNLVSPAVVGMLDERDGVEISNARRIPNVANVDRQFVLPPSRMKMEGVYPHEKGRVDQRYLTAQGIMSLYPERTLWQNYDLGSAQGRYEFIKSRGFEEFFIPAPVTFDVMPYACDMIETGDLMRNLIKVNVSALSDRNSEDTDNLLFKQRELEYIKSLGGKGQYGGFQKFLFAALDFIIDYQASKKS